MSFKSLCAYSETLPSLRRALLLICLPVLSCCVRADVLPNAPDVQYSDYATMQATATTAKFDRTLKLEPGEIGEADNPGARIRFHTDATQITVRLFINDLHAPRNLINSAGVYLIDGKISGTYQSGAARPGEILLSLPASADGRAHLYEIVLPYGDAVEFRGLQVNATAKFEKPVPRPALRWVAYGDSITHGYHASNVVRTYPFQVGQKKNWQVVNMGFGARRATAVDGKVVANLHPDLVTVLIGVNDCNTGKPLDQFKADFAAFLANLRAGEGEKTAPVYVITPLSVVGGGWNNAEAKLPAYRAAIRMAVEARHDAKMHIIEGPDLLPAEARYFSDGLHPSDEGYDLLAENLAVLLPNVLNAPQLK